jgi:cell division protein FtsL
MLDWADGIQGRNYGIRRGPDARSLKEVTTIVSAMLVMAAVLLFYSWVRYQTINQGYCEQALQEKETKLLHAENLLAVEEQTLKNLDRIDSIARNDLGMLPALPGQVLAPQYQDIEPRAGTVLAMAGTAQNSPESKRLSATN